MAPPPYSAFTVPAGTVIGGLAGYFAGEQANKISDIPKIEDLPPGLRPAGYAGEFFGAGVPISGLPNIAARAGFRFSPTLVGRYFNRIIEQAKARPGRFLMTEVGRLTSGAIGAHIAESEAPGNEPVRIGAEMAAGFVSPVSWVIAAGRGVGTGVSKVIGSLSESARQTKAGTILKEIVTMAGEDPAVLAQLLRQSGLPGVELTAAQQTGSPALAAIEKKLGEASAKFGVETAKKGQDALDTMRGMILALRGTGDPEAFKAAGELQGLYFKSLLAAHLENAQNQAALSARKITTDTAAARATLSTQARTALEGALDDSRAVERELWAKVPQNVPASPDNILKEYGVLREGMLKEESMPSIVEGFVARMRKAVEDEAALAAGKAIDKPVPMPSANEIQLFRSRALMLARESPAQGKFKMVFLFVRL